MVARWRSLACRSLAVSWRLERSVASRSSSRASHSAWLRSAVLWLLQLCEGAGHAGEAELDELIDGGMGQQDLSPQW